MIAHLIEPGGDTVYSHSQVVLIPEKKIAPAKEGNLLVKASGSVRRYAGLEPIIFREIDGQNKSAGVSSLGRLETGRCAPGAKNSTPEPPFPPGASVSLMA
jgi:hypothetical protein